MRFLVLCACSGLLAAACSLNTAPSGTVKSQTGSITPRGSAGAANAGESGSSSTISGSGAGSSAGGASAAGAAGTGIGPINGSLLNGPDGGGPAVMCASSIPKDGICKPNAEGIFALKSEFDVWWHDEVNPASSSLTDPGRGKLTIYFLASLDDICTDGSGGHASLRTCGTRLPALWVDSVCKVIQIEFPDAMWDAKDMPIFRTTSSTTGFSPGDILSFAKVTYLVGIDLPNPEATWPTWDQTAKFACPGGTGVKCFPDQDDDHHAGVTVRVSKNGPVPPEPYKCGSGGPWVRSAAPLGLGEAAFGLQGASIVYIGLRMALGGHVKIQDACLHGVGDGESSPTIPSRAIDCVLEDGTPCSAANANFVDQNVPNFHILQAGQTPPPAPIWQHPRENPSWGPLAVKLDRSVSPGPRTSMVRLGDNTQSFDCATVRAADFAPYQ